jgi:hypothetical protein
MRSIAVDVIVFLIGIFAGVVAILSSQGYLSPVAQPYALATLILAVLVEGGWRIYQLFDKRNRESRKDVVLALNELIKELKRLGNIPVRLRANVMMPRGLLCYRHLRIRYYSSNMVNAPDLNIRLQKWMGCAGQVWGSGKTLGANLAVKSEFGTPTWALTPEIEEITSDLKIILCVPLRHPTNGNTVGVLGVDSNSPEATFLFTDKALEDLRGVADIIALHLHIHRFI